MPFKRHNPGCPNCDDEEEEEPPPGPCVVCLNLADVIPWTWEFDLSTISNLSPPQSLIKCSSFSGDHVVSFPDGNPNSSSTGAADNVCAWTENLGSGSHRFLLTISEQTTRSGEPYIVTLNANADAQQNFDMNVKWQKPGVAKEELKSAITLGFVGISGANGNACSGWPTTVTITPSDSKVPNDWCEKKGIKVQLLYLSTWDSCVNYSDLYWAVNGIDRTPEEDGNILGFSRSEQYDYDIAQLALLLSNNPRVRVAAGNLLGEGRDWVAGLSGLNGGSKLPKDSYGDFTYAFSSASEPIRITESALDGLASTLHKKLIDPILNPTTGVPDRIEFVLLVDATGSISDSAWEITPAEYVNSLPNKFPQVPMSVSFGRARFQPALFERYIARAQAQVEGFAS